MDGPPRAFISYRKDDTKQVARALYAELKRVLERDEVFLDQREIEPGASFPNTLRAEIERATVVLVLIGPQWLTLQAPDGVRRLDEPDDWVRQEIELALKARKKIVPVLVEQARPLTKSNFRTVRSIEALAELQAIPLTTQDWEAHFGGIVTLLEGLGFRRKETIAGRGTVPSLSPIFRSNIPALGRRPFVGRSNLFLEMERRLASAAPPQFLVLHGEPGVGKSELAGEFARRRREHYPGGTFVIDASTGGPPVDLANVGARILGLPTTPDRRIEDQCTAALLSLGSHPTLIIYDNVLTPEWVRDWLPPAGMACHVIVTSHWSRWDDRWHTVRVPPLDDLEARDLIEAVSDGHDLREHVSGLVQASGGLPVQLLPATRSLLTAIRSGRPAVVQRELTDESRSSFESPSNRLTDDGRSFLVAATFLHPDRIDPGLLREVLARQLGWSDERFRCAVDACVDLFLVAGEAPLRMHRLLGRFAREKAVSWNPDRLAKSRQGLWERLLEAADKVAGELGNADLALRLLSFDVSVESWSVSERSDAIWGGESHRVGVALSGIGQFEAARSWLEAAVTAKQRGDAHGRVDHDSLGASLHHVGYCLAQTGRHDEARSWLERAVAEKQHNNVNGRINHESLGETLYTIGYCFAQTGKYEEARSWLERAVAEERQGDVHGRVNHEMLGRSLYTIGHCLSETGKYEEASPWFERAVTEAEHGDLQGRVVHESLGRSLDQIGHCLFQTGKYEEARSWFERAVAEKQRGDVHGRVDHDSVGRDFHTIGSCLSRTGKFDKARPWFERAVAEKQHGDMHSRVDHANLGVSLHEVGSCLVQTGKHEEARPWFERAAAEKEQGDVHSRINHASLGRSLHQVGYCLLATGKHEEARPWLERAVAEAEHGDVHGRIDHASIGQTLHMIGYYLSQTGKYEEARSWLERAVTEQQEGDVHGQVDHEILGRSLYTIGYCLSQTGEYRQARAWFERAVAEAQQGDVHGRIDHASLGRSLHEVGYCLSRTGKHDEARPWFEGAVAEKEQGDAHGRVDQSSLETSKRALQEMRRGSGS